MPGTLRLKINPLRRLSYEGKAEEREIPFLMNSVLGKGGKCLAVPALSSGLCVFSLAHRMLSIPLGAWGPSSFVFVLTTELRARGYRLQALPDGPVLHSTVKLAPHEVRAHSVMELCTLAWTHGLHSTSLTTLHCSGHRRAAAFQPRANPLDCNKTYFILLTSVRCGGSYSRKVKGN